MPISQLSPVVNASGIETITMIRTSEVEPSLEILDLGPVVRGNFC